MTTIAIEVAQSEPQSTTRRTYPLPVAVGRGSNCDIQLEAENRAISRTHLEFVEERGRIYVYNRASNVDATQFMGRSLAPNERVAVVPGDRLMIFGTTITIIEPAKLGVLVARRSDLKQLAEHFLLPGGAILAHEMDGVLTVELIADLSHLDAGHLMDRLAVLFYYDGAQPTFAVISNPLKLPVMVDRGIVEQQAIYIQAEDTFEVGAHRFEVMTIGEPSIVCENLECQVLNSHDRGETCRICGTRLYGATRMLRIRKF